MSRLACRTPKAISPLLLARTTKLAGPQRSWHGDHAAAGSAAPDSEAARLLSLRQSLSPEIVITLAWCSTRSSMAAVTTASHANAWSHDPKINRRAQTDNALAISGGYSYNALERGPIPIFCDIAPQAAGIKLMRRAQDASLLGSEAPAAPR